MNVVETDERNEMLMLDILYIIGFLEKDESGVKNKLSVKVKSDH